MTETDVRLSERERCAKALRRVWAAMISEKKSLPLECDELLDRATTAIREGK